jgi:hypothetical protein
LEVKPQADDDDPRTLAVLAQINANLGRREQAISGGRYTVDLMPISKDAYDGPLVLQTLAQVLRLDGTKRARDGIAGKICAFSRLCRLWLSLRDPMGDSLRGDLRFEKILASLAPKEIASE